MHNFQAFSYSNFDTQSTFILTDKPKSLQLPFLFVDYQTSWIGSFKLIYNLKLTISEVVETEINCPSCPTHKTAILSKLKSLLFAPILPIARRLNHCAASRWTVQLPVEGRSRVFFSFSFCSYIKQMVTWQEMSHNLR